MNADGLMLDFSGPEKKKINIFYLTILTFFHIIASYKVRIVIYKVIFFMMGSPVSATE